MDHDQSPIPVGFAPLFRTSPFLDTLGPFCYRPTGEGFVTGVRVIQKHCNARSAAHGGFLVTLADIALGYTAEASGNPPLKLTTINISADFAGYARVGDWLEARVDIQKFGRRLVFANAFLMIGSERIARSSAVFARNAVQEGSGGAETRHAGGTTPAAGEI
jgi:acyl-coenzyme A thioesterase 13